MQDIAVTVLTLFVVMAIASLMGIVIRRHNLKLRHLYIAMVFGVGVLVVGESVGSFAIRLLGGVLMGLGSAGYIYLNFLSKYWK